MPDQTAKLTLATGQWWIPATTDHDGDTARQVVAFDDTFVWLGPKQPGWPTTRVRIAGLRERYRLVPALPTPPSDAGTSERETCADCNNLRAPLCLAEGCIIAAPAAEGPRPEPWTCHRVREYGGTCSTTNDGATCDACGADRPAPALPGAERDALLMAKKREFEEADQKKLGEWVQANLQHHAGKSWSEGIAAEFAALTSEVRALTDRAESAESALAEANKRLAMWGFDPSPRAARLASPSPTGAP